MLSSSIYFESLHCFLASVSIWLRDTAINGGLCPVLKHGPRSLTIVRVCELKTHARNESDRNDLFKDSYDRP